MYEYCKHDGQMKDERRPLTSSRTQPTLSSVTANTCPLILRSLCKYDSVCMVWSRRPAKPPSSMISYSYMSKASAMDLGLELIQRTPCPSIFSFSRRASTHFIRSVEYWSSSWAIVTLWHVEPKGSLNKQHAYP